MFETNGVTPGLRPDALRLLCRSLRTSGRDSFVAGFVNLLRNRLLGGFALACDQFAGFKPSNAIISRKFVPWFSAMSSNTAIRSASEIAAAAVRSDSSR